MYFLSMLDACLNWPQDFYFIIYFLIKTFGLTMATGLLDKNNTSIQRKMNKPLRWMSPPWILGHLSRSNFTKLIKPDRAPIPWAVIMVFLLKLRLVKFEKPEKLNQMFQSDTPSFLTIKVKWQRKENKFSFIFFRLTSLSISPSFDLGSALFLLYFPFNFSNIRSRIGAVSN